MTQEKQKLREDCLNRAADLYAKVSDTFEKNIGIIVKEVIILAQAMEAYITKEDTPIA